MKLNMLKKMCNLRVIDALCSPNSLIGKLIVLRILLESNIEMKGTLIVKGQPLIDIREGSKLYIGDGVTLNSRNKGYHINMHSPVKLFADRQGAEIRIGDRTRIHGTCIHAYQSVVVGRNCLIAANCQIFDGNGHDLSFPNVENRISTRGTSKPVRIEDNVWIGANSVVLPGVTIGRGSVISANSVVDKDIPPMVIAGGNTAIVIKEYKGPNNLEFSISEQL
ncbi:MAG: putative acetyltransferase [Syntrophorhabdus sp. PtaB.Bin006]|nr:MAG: putative acetyltransferase [Syntrophorhabdus sp. PtaB.Bin006]